METIGSKRSYALIWCMPNNDDDDDISMIFSMPSSAVSPAPLIVTRSAWNITLSSRTGVWRYMNLDVLQCPSPNPGAVPKCGLLRSYGCSMWSTRRNVCPLQL